MTMPKTKSTRLMRTAQLAALLLVACWTGPAWPETIVIDGVTRTFTAQLPNIKPAPLVIVLHGQSQTGADMMMRTSWPHVAKRERFGVAFPDGRNRAWADLRFDAKRAPGGPPEGTNDVAFITRIIETYVADGSADPKRIYLTGVSNGGAMTMTLVCQRADLFAAAASVVMNLTDDLGAACHPPRPVPMLIMNGTADPLIPYRGGRTKRRLAAPTVWSTEKTIEFWRRINGCEAGDGNAIDLDDIDRSDRSTVTRIDSRCPAGRDVVLYRVNNGGHRMPGSLPDARFTRAVNLVLGPQNRDIDGAETIWDFFRGFP
jgi:polyhydroxybutyrate depolymerase